MIKEALQYIVGLGKAELFVENGQSYSDEKLHLIEEPTAGPFAVNTLSGLVDYVISGVDEAEKIIIHVVNPTEVRVESPLNSDKQRDYYVVAEALIPEFRFDRFYDAETFNIKLQSTFVKNEDRDIMLKVVGNIKEENVASVGDDGTSQSVVAKTGVASVGNVKVPNPVLLAPYRTFVEVEQPKSEFVFRMQSGPTCALFEADGGAWKILAMKRIKEYLEEQLEEQISNQKVYIIG